MPTIHLHDNTNATRGEAGADPLVTPAAGLLPRRIGLGRRQRGHEAAP
jgi:hypothetical protein